MNDTELPFEKAEFPWDTFTIVDDGGYVWLYFYDWENNRDYSFIIG